MLQGIVTADALRSITITFLLTESMASRSCSCEAGMDRSFLSFPSISTPSACPMKKTTLSHRRARSIVSFIRAASSFVFPSLTPADHRTSPEESSFIFSSGTSHAEGTTLALPSRVIFGFAAYVPMTARESSDFRGRIFSSFFRRTIPSSAILRHR